MLGSAPILVSGSAVDSMTTPILVAVVALLGTIIGAVIGAATNYFIATRRESADRERENRNHAIELRRAARLIDIELRQAEIAAEICRDAQEWWSLDAPELSTQ